MSDDIKKIGYKLKLNNSKIKRDDYVSYRNGINDLIFEILPEIERLENENKEMLAMLKFLKVNYNLDIAKLDSLIESVMNKNKDV